MRTLLDYSYPNLIINPFTGFTDFTDLEHEDGYGYGYGNFPSEAELLCFDPLPPSLFDFNPPPPLSIPPLAAPPLFNIDDFHFPPQDLHFDDLIIPNPNYPTYPNYPILEEPPLFNIDDFHFPPQDLHFDDLIIPNPNYPTYPNYPNYPLLEEPSPFAQGFSSQFLNFPKKQKVSSSLSYPENYYIGAGVGDGVEGGKTREVSAQSKAARERRRRITEKTQELGKLVPGGTKMNTAEMFQAAAKYVKFLQAQLGLLNTLQNNLPQESIKEANLNNLPILGSTVVQEKLYTKEKCLFPMDFLPILEKHLDFEGNPTISKDINDLIH